ncbi:tubulin polyglutamylase TTLL4-like [Branchiostoma floridae]|uniref:Tubulin polyglutamylase TTLL4-like n=1 Tax=Branchiostoma floridae TaxID=7739 RepID=A0A9J7LUN5_BRAFL|nr:tubulin polyglutamylase TTLL4-like [Branchiostoma floridae]
MDAITGKAGLEKTLSELALAQKKQLPLRQQTDRPLLKYPLNHTVKVHYSQLQGQKGVNAAPPNGVSYRVGSLAGTNANTNTKSSPTKGTSGNPYTRPVSAKDLEDPTSPDNRGMKATNSTPNMVTPGRPAVIPISGAFIRPSSAKMQLQPKPPSQKTQANRVSPSGKDSSAGNSPRTSSQGSMPISRRSSQTGQQFNSGSPNSKGNSRRNSNTSLVSSGLQSSNSPSIKENQSQSNRTSPLSNKSSSTGTSPQGRVQDSSVNNGASSMSNAANARRRLYSDPSPATKNKMDTNPIPQKNFILANLNAVRSRTTFSKDNTSASITANTKPPLPPNGKPKVSPNAAVLKNKPVNSSAANVKTTGVETKTTKPNIVRKQSSGTIGVKGEGSQPSSVNSSPRAKIAPNSQLNSKQDKAPFGKSLQGGKTSGTKNVERDFGDGAVSAPRKEVEPVTFDPDDMDDEWSDVEEGEENEDSIYEDPEGERLPGDGCSTEVDDEEDMIDDINDDVGSDDDDVLSVSSSASQLSLVERTASARPALVGEENKQGHLGGSDADRLALLTRSSYRTTSAEGALEMKPPLIASLFSNVSPVIYFGTDAEKIAPLPYETRKLLKWRLSTITPIVVKNVLGRSHFKLTKKGNDWLGYWGKHMKSNGFRSVREFQKVNHFPGTFQIGRKDRLWRNLSRMQVHYGKKDFNFFPLTFVLPSDFKQLKRTWEDGGTKQKWIIKPPASARGIGIKVIHKWNQVPRKRPVIVQRYLSRPYLINGSKFDLRLYVYVTSYDPLRVYLFQDGLVRFATCKYSFSMKSLSNRFMHLTNYSVNKRNAEFTPNSDKDRCEGHKWGLQALWRYLQRGGINTDHIWEQIKDLVIKTIICCESAVNSLVKANVRRRYCVNELFGFDIMLDSDLKPWILEVNISPSLHSNSPLDVNIKGQMIRDLMNLAGFQIPDKTVVMAANNVNASQTFSTDKRHQSTDLAPDEKAKHAFFVQKYIDEQLRMTITDTLTPDDVRMLIETEDEFNRRGMYERIFPSPTSNKYHRFFEQPRYYNILMDEWVRRYHRQHSRGIGMLDAFCQHSLHVGTTTNPAHQWAPPKFVRISRDQRSISAPLTHGAMAGLPRIKKKGHKGSKGNKKPAPSSGTVASLSMTKISLQDKPLDEGDERSASATS